MDIFEFIKDMGPIIIAILALYFGDRQIRKKAKIESKFKLLDELRIYSVKFLTIQYEFYNNIDREGNYDKGVYSKFMEHMLYMELLLDKNDQVEKELADQLAEVRNYIKQIGFKKSVLSNNSATVFNLCEKVIDNRQKKLM